MTANTCVSFKFNICAFVDGKAIVLTKIREIMVLTQGIISSNLICYMADEGLCEFKLKHVEFHTPILNGDIASTDIKSISISAFVRN